MLFTIIKINEANKKSCKECGKELDG